MPPPQPGHPLEPLPSNILLLLLVVVVLVLLNGFFVAAEFALVSVRRTRIDQLAAEGNSTAGAVQRALRDLDRQIGAAQVGITIVSLVLGSQGEKILEPLFAHGFHALGMPDSLWGVTRAGISLVLAYLIMTSMHVVIGEQLPKMFAIQRAELAAMIIVRPMMSFTVLCAPLVWVLTRSVTLMLGWMGLQAAEGHAQVHSPEELDLLFTQSHEGGQLTQTERELLHRVVKFSDLTAREVMIPRVEMRAVPVELPRQEFFDFLNGRKKPGRFGSDSAETWAPHTRTPIYRETLDEIVGIAHLKDLVRHAGDLREHPETDVVNLMKVKREALRVPETITIDKLLVAFKNHRQQMAIVIDEYGGTAGLITMGDLLAQVFGDVHDEFDRPEPEVVEDASGKVELAGKVLIDEVNERYETGFNGDDADTMAGLVLNELGRPAEVGDEVEINSVKLRVLALDRLRITRLEMIRPQEAKTSRNGGEKAA